MSKPIGYFSKSSMVKVKDEYYDIEYDVYPRPVSVIGIRKYDYTILLTSVQGVPAEWLTDEAKLAVVEAIDDDIYSEVLERVA